MIIFSEITCRADTTSFVSRGLVSGMPVCYADLIDWTIFQDFLKECTQETKITIEVRTFGYGEGEQFDATAEEVAYMLQRCKMNERFCDTRCEKIRQYKISIDLSAFGKHIGLSKVIQKYVQN
jgi:hypothetical protein